MKYEHTKNYHKVALMRCLTVNIKRRLSTSERCVSFENLILTQQGLPSLKYRRPIATEQILSSVNFTSPPLKTEEVQN